MRGSFSEPTGRPRVAPTHTDPEVGLARANGPRLECRGRVRERTLRPLPSRVAFSSFQFHLFYGSRAYLLADVLSFGSTRRLIRRVRRPERTLGTAEARPSSGRSRTPTLSNRTEPPCESCAALREIEPTRADLKSRELFGGSAFVRRKRTSAQPPSALSLCLPWRLSSVLSLSTCVACVALRCRVVVVSFSAIRMRLRAFGAAIAHLCANGSCDDPEHATSQRSWRSRPLGTRSLFSRNRIRRRHP